MLKKIILYILIHKFKADALCSRSILVSELKQDIADNGRLDCKRYIPKPHGMPETIEDKNKRIAAQWDSDCSFEADDSWVATI